MPQDKTFLAKNQPPTMPRSERAKRNSEKAQKMLRAAATEQLSELEARNRLAIIAEAEKTHSDTMVAYNKQKTALEKEAFDVVDAPAAVAAQHSANRFGFFSTIASSFGYFASCFNPLGRKP